MMCFHDHGGAVLTKAQIIRDAQRHCDDAMEKNVLCALPYLWLVVQW